MFKINRKGALGLLNMAIIPILALVAIANSVGAETTDEIFSDDQVLAVVNDDTIYVSALDSSLVSAHKSMNMDQLGEAEYQKLLNKLINDRLLLQEAWALELDQDEKLQTKLDGYRKDNAIRSFVRADYKPNLDIAETDIIKYFYAYYSKMQIRTIAVASLEQAEELSQLILDGARFDSIASELSLDMYKYKGGIHNLKYYGDIEKELRDRAENLPVGGITKPFKYREVYAFLKVEERFPADTTELELNRKNVISALKGQKRDAEWLKYISNLSKEFEYETNEAALGHIMDDSAALFTEKFTAPDNGGIDDLFNWEDKVFAGSLDIRKAISYEAMQNGGLPFDSLFKIGYNKVWEKFILASAAFKNSFYEDKKVIAKHNKSLDSALIEIYIKETVLPQISFNRENFEKYYDDNIDNFRQPDEYQFAMIKVSEKETAIELETKLKDGADFGYLAKQHNEDKTLKTGEDDWVTLESFPLSIKQDLGNLKIGESSKAYQTTEGWLIFKKKTERKGIAREFADVEIDIRQIMFQKQFEANLDNILSTLRENSVIKYNRKAIEQYFGEAGKESEES